MSLSQELGRCSSHEKQTGGQRRFLDADLLASFTTHPAPLNNMNVKTQDVRLMSAHDLRCLAGTDTGHVERYYTRWLGQDTDPPNTITVDYLRIAREGKPPYTNDTTRALGSAVRDRAGAGGLADAGTFDDVEGLVRPSVINEAISMDLSCARDHKWRLVSMAIERQECNCLNQVLPDAS